MNTVTVSNKAARLYQLRGAGLASRKEKDLLRLLENRIMAWAQEQAPDEPYCVSLPSGQTLFHVLQNQTA